MIVKDPKTSFAHNSVKQSFNIICALWMLYLIQNYFIYVTSQGISLPTTSTTTIPPLNNGVCSIPGLSPCVPAAICTPSSPIIGEAICTCPPGYAGDGRRADVYGIGCNDIDECLSGTDNCDRRSEVCINTNGGYTCECANGYKRDQSKLRCIDIDECIAGRDICNEAESMCYNTPGSYDCICYDIQKVFDFTTLSCRFIDYCNDNEGSFNPCSQVCSMANNEPVCSCFDGYYLSNDNVTCLDINECVTGENSCDPNGIISVCINTLGSYRCECNMNMGYENSPNGLTCLNYNECVNDSAACGTGAMCCLDLPPPQRYLCLVPGEEYNSETPSNTQQQMSLNTIYEMLKSQGQILARSNESLNNSDFSNPTVNSLNFDNLNINDLETLGLAIGNDVSEYDKHLNKLFPVSLYSSPSEIENIQRNYGSFNHISRHSDSYNNVQNILKNQCFKINTVYMDIDCSPPHYNVLYAATCQNICIADPKCSYYSFNVNNNTCHLKATSFTQYSDTNFVSGSQDCKIESIMEKGETKLGILSLGYTGFEPLHGIPNLFERYLSDENKHYLKEQNNSNNENLKTSDNKIPIDLNKHPSEISKKLYELEIFEGVVPSHVCGGTEGFHGHCLIAGSLNKSEINHILSYKKPINYIYRTLNRGYIQMEPVKESENITELSNSNKYKRFLSPLLSKLSQPISSLNLTPNWRHTPILNIDNLPIGSSGLGLLNFSNSKKNSSSTMNINPSTNSIELKSNTPQNGYPVSSSNLLVKLTGGFDNLLGIDISNTALPLYSSNIGVLDSLLPHSILSPSCPANFIYSPDVARSKRRERAVDIAREFFVNENNGTSTPVDPSNITNSLVSNTEYIANELNKWYVELASAPLQVASAAFGVNPAQSTYQPSELILSEQTLPGGQVPASPNNIDNRKKLNSALLTTFAILEGINLKASKEGRFPY